MANFKIIDVRRIPSAEDGRAGKLDHLVTYSLDHFRNYMLTIPKDQITLEDIRVAVKADLEKIDHFIGKELSTEQSTHGD